MVKINFVNNDKPYINADNLNKLQNNVEAGITDAINETVKTINSKNITIGNEVETDEVVGEKRVYKKRRSHRKTIDLARKRKCSK